MAPTASFRRDGGVPGPAASAARVFVLTRLAAFVGAVLGTALLLFVLLDLLPGAAASDGSSALGRLFGPLVGDFGVSTSLGAPVSGTILERLAVTLPLLLLAFLVSAGGMGVALADNARGRWIEALGTVLSVIPPFWLGMLLALLGAGVLKLLPASGFVPWSSPGGALLSLLLPALALGLPHAGQLAVRVRRAFAEVDDTDAVFALRTEGVVARAAERQVRRARVVPLLPQMLGKTLGAIAIGAALVESVFYLPGLGRQVLGAAVEQNLVLLRGSLLVLVGIVALGMLGLSLLRLLVDPALRQEPR